MYNNTVLDPLHLLGEGATNAQYEEEISKLFESVKNLQNEVDILKNEKRILLEERRSFIDKGSNLENTIINLNNDNDNLNQKIKELTLIKDDQLKDLSNQKIELAEKDKTLKKVIKEAETTALNNMKNMQILKEQNAQFKESLRKELVNKFLLIQTLSLIKEKIEKNQLNLNNFLKERDIFDDFYKKLEENKEKESNSYFELKVSALIESSKQMGESVGDFIYKFFKN